jgi:hypothetical protein
VTTSAPPQAKQTFYMAAHNSALLDMCHIHHRLWIGAYPDEAWLLPSFGIDRVYLCASERQHLPAIAGLTVVPFGFDDAQLSSPEWQWLLRKAREIAVHIRYSERDVLISCNQGMNRAPLVAGAVLHVLTGRSGADIIGLLRRNRDGVLSNRFFADALGSLPAAQSGTN